jgi:hypothetical protein
VVEVPASVLANWREWFPGRVDALQADIRQRSAAAVDAWGLTGLAPLPGGEVALVLAARHAGGEAVLKLSPRVTGLDAESRALALWSARGISPELWGTRDDGLTLLLARVRPGVSLRDTGAGAEEIVETIGGLCPAIHVRVEPGRFETLARFAEQEGWTETFAGTAEQDELARLVTPSEGDRLLHVDLHWLNVVRGDRWLVIDPKARVGDPHAEVFVFFDGPPLTGLPDGRLRAREHLHALTERYARAAGLDGDRVRAWVRLRGLAMLSEAGVGHGPKREAIARLVDALA